MQRASLAAFLNLLICTIVSAEQGQPAPTGPDHERQTIINEARRLDNAVIHRDVGVYQQVVPADWSIINESGQVKTREQMVNDLKSGQFNVESLTREAENIRILGNTAIDTGILNVRGQDHGRVITGQYRFTNVWMNRNGHWQPVASQVTPIEAGQGPKPGK